MPTVTISLIFSRRIWYLMLDDSLQLKLADTIPLGMNVLPEHLKYRRQINEQQRQLMNLAPSSPKSLQVDLGSVLPYRWGVAPTNSDYCFAELPEGYRTIVIQVPMKLVPMQNVPSLKSASEILRSYAEAGKLVVIFPSIC